MSTDRPIFLLGVTPRSGTNFLWDLLRLHPNCVIPREPIWEDNLLVHADLLEAYARRTAASWHDAGEQRARLGAQLLASVGEGLCSFLRTTPGRLVTKTPHVHRLDAFFPLFPDAALVLLVRDGRAVAQSARDTFGGTLEGWARRWAEAVDTVLRFDEDHRGQGLRYRIVRYEDLVEDRRARLRELFAFLELDPATYDFDAADELPVRGSSALKRGDAVEWGPVRAGPGFDPTTRFAAWSPRTHRRFNWIAARQLQALGYEARHTGTSPLREIAHRLRDLAWAVSRPVRVVRARLAPALPRPRRDG